MCFCLSLRYVCVPTLYRFRVGTLIALLLTMDLIDSPSAAQILDKQDDQHEALPIFDSSRRTNAFIANDPDALGWATNMIVSGATGSEVAGPFAGNDVNQLVGTDRFYANGFNGSRVIIFNVEAGYIDDTHETLTHSSRVHRPTGALSEVDRHATWVGSIMSGRMGGTDPGEYQLGIASGADLFSGVMASQWQKTRYSLSFSFFFRSLAESYRDAFVTGIDGTRTADVINSSFGTEDSTATQRMAITVDGLANQNPQTLLAAAAGNTGPDSNTVISPAAAYNTIAVAALASSGNYGQVASFSSRGPNDYGDPTNGTSSDARWPVDIAAPGQRLGVSYYGGETGGNGTADNVVVEGSGPTGFPSGPAGGPDWYSRSKSGTSLSTPIVAGGAALLYDVAYDVFNGTSESRDARVIKAVLMNSADKTVGWNNGQVPHPNGKGGVQTLQALDQDVGTGRINLDRSYDQFLSGTTDVPNTSHGNQGNVATIGWDFGNVTEGIANDYTFNESLEEGATLTATLSWFRDRRVDVFNNAFDESFDDLDLELWTALNGTAVELISESASPFNSSEHFSFAIPKTGDYLLRVKWDEEIFDVVDDVNNEDYGLAWLIVPIPEPASWWLMIWAVVWCTGRRRQWK